MAKEKQLQLEFTKTAEKKNKLTIAKSNLRKILQDNSEFIDTKVAIEQLKEKLKQILTGVGEAYPDLIAEIGILKMDLKAEKELLSDLAINKLISGEEVQVKDNDGFAYEPSFNVTFKKI